MLQKTNCKKTNSLHEKMPRSVLSRAVFFCACTARRILLPVLVLSFLSSSCRVGGSLTANGTAVTVSTTPNVVSPTTTLSSPYYSNQSLLTLTGLCNIGSTVNLSGDSIQSTPCAMNSTYTFTVIETNDSVYAFSLTQTDSSGNVSPVTSFVWVRKTTLAAPTIATLNGNTYLSPYFSGDTTLSISGACEYGSTLSYTISPGSVSPTTQTCSSSNFTFSVNAGSDQTYTINLTETDLAQNTASTGFVWKKKTLSSTPSTSFTVTAGQSTPATLSISGGTGSYQVITSLASSTLATTTLSTSDPVNTPAVFTFSNTYTQAGSYTLTLSDTKDASIGTLTITVNVQANQADHLALVTPTPSAVGYGKLHSSPFQVQVLDQYNNPVSGYQVLFNLMTGDAQVMNQTLSGETTSYTPASGLATSNASGIASMYIQNGHQFLNSRFSVRCGTTANCSLPDAALSGNATISFTTPKIISNSIWNFGQSFQAGPSGNSASAATFVSARFNNTGLGTKGDLAVLSFTQSNASVLMVYVGKGNGLFQTPVTYNLPSSCKINSNYMQMIAMDFDGDGNQDLAILCSGNNNSSLKPIAIAKGNGDGTFAHTTSGSTLNLTLTGVGPALTDSTLQLAAFTAGDFNGDGKPDLAYLFTSSSSIISSPYYNAPSVTVILSTSTVGSFSFGSASIYPLDAASSPTAIVAANLHKNYNPSNSGLDLIIGDFRADTNLAVVGVLPNQGNGIFPQTFNSGTGLNPGYINFSSASTAAGINSLYVSDIDADGLPDVIAANAGDTTVTLFIGDGNLGSGSHGFNASPTTVQVGDIPNAVMPLNLNQNGLLEIAVATNSSITLIKQTTQDVFTVSTASFTNNALNTLTAINTLDPSLTTTAATIPSLVVLGNDGGSANMIQVISPNKNTTANFGLSYALPGTIGGKTYTPKLVVKTDFNNDQIEDLAILSVDTGGGTYGIVSFFKGNGDGSFTQVQQSSANFTISFSAGETPVGLVFADFDGDGINDLAILTQNNNLVNIYKGNGDGTFTAQSTFSVAMKPTALAVGDLNHDGKPDLIVSAIGSTSEPAYDKQLSVLLNTTPSSSAISFAAHADYGLHGSGANTLILQDFNKDGNLDVVTSNADGTLSVAYSNANGTFNPDINFPSLSISTAAFTTPVVAGNFFGHTDGTLDLATLNQDSSTTLLINNTANTLELPFGQTTNPQAVLALGGSNSLLAGDFTGSGYIDLISTISSFSLYLSYTHNTPTSPVAGEFASPNLYAEVLAGFDNQSSQSSVINTVISGDFDGNGSSDFIVLDSTNNQFQVWLSQ